MRKLNKLELMMKRKMKTEMKLKIVKKKTMRKLKKKHYSAVIIDEDFVKKY